MSHTPEPWEIAEDNCGGGINITATGKRIAHTSENRGHCNEKQIINEQTAKENATV